MDFALHVPNLPKVQAADRRAYANSAKADVERELELRRRIIRDDEQTNLQSAHRPGFNDLRISNILDAYQKFSAAAAEYQRKGDDDAVNAIRTWFSELAEHFLHNAFPEAYARIEEYLPRRD